MDSINALIENGKIKRYFRARNKPSFEGAITHVTQHASGEEPLFLEESDYFYMLNLIRELSRAFELDMLSFVLMTNHVHLLMKLGKLKLADAMKELFRLYAVYFNKKYGRDGHLFSGAYRSALCLDNSYLLTSSLYIHNNPVEAGMVDDPVDYKWSSCFMFLKETDVDTFVDYKFILAILDKDMGRARVKYRDLLNQDKFRDSEGIEENIKKFKQKKRLKNSSDLQARKFLIEQLITRGHTVKDISTKLDITRCAVYRILKYTF